MKLPTENEQKADNEKVDALIETANAWNVDFSDYEWMGEEMEEFDNKCMNEIKEEDFIEESFAELHMEEEKFYTQLDDYLADLNQSQVNAILAELDSLDTRTAYELANQQSGVMVILPQFRRALNPNAPEFVPREHQLPTSGLVPENDNDKPQ